MRVTEEGPLAMRWVGGRGEEDLHDSGRVVREVGFIFLTLVVIPPTVLPPFLFRLAFFFRNLRAFVCIPIL